MERKKAIQQFKKLRELGSAKKMRLAAEGWGKEWQTLISILMSARTRDETTVIVAEKLFTKFSSLGALGKAEREEVYAIIRPINFSRNKTKNVIACARALATRFKGRVPRDREKLITLPGVGRKTANVFLAEYGADTIGVDTHVAYISKKLGWTAHDHPHKIEQDLLTLFPQKYWRALNRALVRFGKSHASRRRKDEVLESLLASNF